MLKLKTLLPSIIVTISSWIVVSISIFFCVGLMEIRYDSMQGIISDLLSGLAVLIWLPLPVVVISKVGEGVRSPALLWLIFWCAWRLRERLRPLHRAFLNINEWPFCINLGCFVKINFHLGYYYLLFGGSKQIIIWFLVGAVRFGRLYTVLLTWQLFSLIIITCDQVFILHR